MHMSKTATARNKATNWNKGGMLGKKKIFSRKWVGRETVTEIFWCSLRHCYLFLCFSSPARIAFDRNFKKKTKQGLPLVYFKCGSASTLPVYGRSRLQVSIGAFWSKKVWNECSRVAFPSSCINNFIYKELLKLGVTFLHWGDFFPVAPDARLHF